MVKPFYPGREPPREGTTQGDPLGMAMYAIRIQALVKHLDSIGIKQVWYMYADDSAAGGNLENLKSWWTELCRLGYKFGYFPNAAKSCLFVESGSLPKVKSVFADTSLKILEDGHEVPRGSNWSNIIH